MEWTDPDEETGYADEGEIVLHHIGRRFDPLKLPGRSPPMSEDFLPDPFPDYGPQ
jgi:hypothetical protein